MSLIAMPFFAILFAIIQLGYRFFAAEALETAVGEGARAIMTGRAQATSGISSPEQFRDQILCDSTNRLLPFFMDCSKVYVDVRQLSTFSDAAFATSGVDLLNGASRTYDPGVGGKIVVVRAAYGLPAIAPSLTGGGSVHVEGQDVYPLLGVFVFRNEPFS